MQRRKWSSKDKMAIVLEGLKGADQFQRKHEKRKQVVVK